MHTTNKQAQKRESGGLPIGGGTPTSRYRPLRLYDADGEELWPMTRVAQYLGVTREQAREWRLAGRIPALRVGQFFGAYPSDVMVFKRQLEGETR